MKILLLQSADAAAFQALRLRGLQESPSSFASSVEEEAPLPLQTIAERLASQSDGVVFGAFINNQLVGIAGLQREAQRKLAHKAFVWGVYVAPESRRQGVAEQLLRAAVEHARREFSVRQINLGVNTRNAPAIALYKRLGFVEFGLERGYLCHAGTLHDEYHMVLYSETPIER